MSRFEEMLQELSAATVQLGALASIFLLGLIDYWSGPQVAFSVFYLLPLSVLAWKVGFRGALPACALAATTWRVADEAAGAPDDGAGIPIWNGVTRLLVFLVVVTLLSNLREAVRLQQEMAYTDTLTGISNARYFNQAAQRLIAASHHGRQPLTVAYLDLDHFKRVNDTLGHSAGDDILEAVSRALEDNTRSSDVVARLGGDEFALLLPSTGSYGARRVMSNLVERVSQGMTQLPMPVTFSAGAATFLVPPINVDEMVKVADALMYKAKREGRGTFRLEIIGQGMPGAMNDETPRRRPMAEPGGPLAAAAARA